MSKEIPKDFLPSDENLAAFKRIEETDRHVFITGKAGTGKSTFLQYFRGHTAKNCVVLAPTGVAALNVKGQTIHSFFSFKPDITVDTVSSVRVLKHMKKVYQNLDLIIIDEISMVRADLIDCIDAFLRRNGPRNDQVFGGIQMLFIGDLYQLSPVVRQEEQSIFQSHYPSPYFFDARVFQYLDMDFIEFETMYRQKDPRFIELLNGIRTNAVQQEDLDAINERCLPDFVPSDKQFFIYLTTTNKLADQINQQQLHLLREELVELPSTRSGDFDNRSLPTHEDLELKLGAQVMLLNNDPEHRWVNGSIGKILDFYQPDGEVLSIVIELSDGQRVEVEPFTWELFHFYFDEDTEAIESEVVGKFRQFPIKLAWAVTIHKSQGKTFKRMIIDIGRGTFCHGQLYVALSRCTTLDGIILKQPIARRHIVMDRRVTEFLTGYQYRLAGDRLPMEERRAIIEAAIAAEQELEIVYLRENNTRHRRRIIPRQMRSIEYDGEPCLGVEAFCLDRQTNWIFRLNCMLDIQPVGETVPNQE